MRKYMLGFFAALALLICFGIAFTTPLESALKTVAQSASMPRDVVHKIGIVQDGKVIGSGSGVMIAPLLMLTAAHVANAGPVLAIDGDLAPVRVLRVDPKNDIALLMVAVNCPCATLATRPVRVDQPVTAVGFPYHHVLGAQIMTEGRVQGTAPTGQTIFTAPVARGNSGGGLFVLESGRYKLVGIVVGVIRDGMGGSVPHLATAMSLEQINAFLANRSPVELESVQPGTVKN